MLGSVNLNNGVAILDTRFSATGIHGVTATYAGDSNNGGTSMTTWFNITAAATTIQLVPSVNPARPKQAVTLSATVAGANPTGMVTFNNGNTLLGTALLTAGTASITQAFSTVGNYTLTASYSGDTNNQASTSAPLTLAVSLEPQVYYIHTDHLDTPRTLTDTSGNVVWQWDNTDPFGANMPNENPSGAGQFTFNLRFAGQYFDRETGLNYNVNRDYSPALGRYVESDPVGLIGGINIYTYVEGNPLTWADPLGLWSTDAHHYFIDGFAGNNRISEAIRAMKAGSDFADAPQFQMPGYEYMHAMRSDADSVDQAKQKACQYFEDKMNVYQLNLRNGRTYDAYFALGMALHAVMDSTSPVHAWGIFSYSDSNRHGDMPGTRENLGVAKQAHYQKTTLDAMRQSVRNTVAFCGCKK